MKFILSLLMLIFLSCSQLPTQPSREQLLQKGREIHIQFLNGQTLAVWKNFTEEMKTLFKNYENFENFRKEFLARVGNETEVTEELAYPSNVLHSLYYRKVAFEKTKGSVLTVQWAFEKEGKISGFYLKNLPPPAYSPYLKYESKNTYYFPVDANGYIAWGGRKIEENYHVTAANQRFAYDIIVTDGKRTAVSEQNQNEDFLCFGKNIFSAANGKVVVAHDGIEDNIPGENNEKQYIGNYVVIDHGNNEFAYYAHLKKGSVVVNPGQIVDEKTVIGKCGNSGRSSQPHLHFHVQNASAFDKGLGLPISFSNVKVNGEIKEKFEPVLGDTVSRN